MTLPALSIKQTWAFAVAHLGKDVENRSWQTRYRGPIALHATKQWDADGEHSAHVQDAWRRYVRALPPLNCHHGPLRKTSLWIEFGALIAVAEVTGCHKHGDPAAFCGAEGAMPLCSPWAALNAWHWHLTSVRPLRHPVPVRGALGLWPLPKGVEKTLRTQLERE